MLVNAAPKLRPTIVMQTGPLHLFWATGVFIFWELQARYDFILLVSADYRESTSFQKLVQLPAIIRVEYAPVGNRFALHRHYHTRYAELLTQFQPECALLYSQSYPDNLYLMDLCNSKSPHTKRYCYQLGRMPINWETDFAAAKSEAVARFSARHPILKSYPRLARHLLGLRNHVGFFLNYYFTPLLAAGKLLHPPLNVYSGVANCQAMQTFTSGPLDTQLVYVKKEMQVFQKLGIENRQLVRHPVFHVGEAVLRFLHGDFTISDTILVLPSSAPSCLLALGWSERRAIDHMAQCWAAAMQGLLAIFPGYQIKIKLHPSAMHDQIWSEILRNILRDIPTLQVVAIGENAEWHIAQSRVIVGDVTSALWWAAMFGNKQIVSLDIFGFPGGDDMKHYADSMQYVTAVEQIRNVPSVMASDDFRPAAFLADVIGT